MNPRNIDIKSYDYNLPDNKIAKYPLAERDLSKLLIFCDGNVEERHFYDLPEEIPSGSLMIFNNTRVIQARLHFQKETGAQIEVFCLEPESPRDYQQNFASEHECTWTCLVGNSKKWKDGALSQIIEIDGEKVVLSCERIGESGASQTIHFFWDKTVSFAKILDAIGELPIPPYLNRATEEKDKQTYQTVYSRIKGSVAAPTAGLHFTEKELAALRDKNVSLQYLTLHVGAGTFKPVKSKTIEGHDMHTEFISVPKDVIETILNHKSQSNNAPLVAVGTTSVRTLESLYYIGNKLAQNPEAHPEELVVHQWEPYDNTYSISVTEALRNIIYYLERCGEDKLVTATQILIAPGFSYRLVNAIVTNFHMPQSTLLLLVSAFVDGDRLEGLNWHKIYDYALSHDFRFLSYGDSSLLFPCK